MSLMQQAEGAATGAAGLLGGAGIGAGTQLLSGAISSIFNNAAINKQVEAQKELTDYNTNAAYQEQMKVWNNTNYPAQVQQMQQAGLNPALIYGKGGGGGATVGNGATTGTVNSSIPTNTNSINMMALQGAMLEAQIKNINADTQQKLTQSNVNESQPAVQASQVKTNNASASLAEANTSLIQTENQLNQIQLNYQNDTYDTRVQQFKDTAQTIAQNLTVVTNDATVSTQTKQAKIMQQLENVAETWTTIQAQKAGIQLTQKQTWQIGQTIAQNWQYVKQGQQNANTNESNQMQTNAQGWENIKVKLQQTGIEQQKINYLFDREGEQNFKDATDGITNLMESIGKAAMLAE